MIYSNTRLTAAGSGFGGQNNNVLIDDVLVPAERNPRNLPLAITSVTVSVLINPSLTTDVLSLWNYPVEADGTPGFERVLVGTTDVLVEDGEQRVTFGDGLATLFTARPVFGVEPGYGLLYIGLGSSLLADWSWADGPDVNRPTAFNHNMNVNRIFINSTPGPPFPSHVSYFMDITAASPIPEPATLSTLATGVIASWCARHLKKRRSGKRKSLLPA